MRKQTIDELEDIFHKLALKIHNDYVCGGVVHSKDTTFTPQTETPRIPAPLECKPPSPLQDAPQEEAEKDEETEHSVLVMIENDDHEAWIIVDLLQSLLLPGPVPYMCYQRFSKLSMQRRAFDVLKIPAPLPHLLDAALRRHNLFEVEDKHVMFLQICLEFHRFFVVTHVRDRIVQNAARPHDISHPLHALQSALSVQHVKLFK